jgi:tetratricopeptide (TPR) repeat protein
MTDLDETLLTETIRGLHHSGWSGVVAVSSGDVTKGLYFRRGRFVFAASTVEDDKLGEFLVRTGRINRGQFEAALLAAQAPGRRLGQVLVEIGAVNDLDLEDLVAEQLHRIAVSAFRWTAGTALTEEVEEPIPADIALPLSTERLLLEGARTYPDPRRLEQALGDPGRRVQRAENVRPAFNYRRVSESRAEKAVLAALRAPKTIAELLSLPSPRPALVRAVYALFVGGLLEDAASETPAAGMTVASAVPASVPPVAAPRPVAMPDPAAPLPPGLAALSSDVEKEARALLEKGERLRALTLLREEAERDPKARGCRRLLALLLAHQEQGLSPELERLMHDLLEEDGRDVELRYRLAMSYKKAGTAAPAIRELKQVLAADPGHAAAWRDLAELEASESAGGKRRPRP